MGASYRVSPRLKQALAKLSALPHDEQDEVAAQIMARIAGDEWTSPMCRMALVGDVLDRVLPKNSVARAFTIIFVTFILCVQTPAILIFGVSALIRAANDKPTGTKEVTQFAAGNVTHSVVREGVARPQADSAQAEDAP